jgi:hypothetical protein
MEYLLKVSRLGNKTVIYGIGLGDDKTTSFDLTTKDYISESSLPATPVSSSDSPEDTIHSIQNIFISPSRLADLGSLLKLNVIQRLIPGLQKEGYEETKESTSTTSATDTTQQNPRAESTTQPPPRRPNDYDPLRDDRLPALARPRVDPYPGPDFPPPGFEDPYDLTRPARRQGPGGYAPNIGERDLYPQGLGPNDPLRIGGVGPGLRGGPGGGMMPDFDDPVFGNRGGDEGFFNPLVPPGARYDPTGPFGEGAPMGGMRGPRGGFGGGRGGFGGGFGGPGGAPHNPFGGFGGGDFI